MYQNLSSEILQLSVKSSNQAFFQQYLNRYNRLNNAKVASFTRRNDNNVSDIEFNSLRSVSNSKVPALYLMLKDSSIFFILAK